MRSPNRPSTECRALLTNQIRTWFRSLSQGCSNVLLLISFRLISFSARFRRVEATKQKKNESWTFLHSHVIGKRERENVQARGPVLRIRAAIFRHFGKPRKYNFIHEKGIKLKENWEPKTQRSQSQRATLYCVHCKHSFSAQAPLCCDPPRQPNNTSQSDESHSSYVHDVAPAALRKETQCFADLRDSDFLNKYFVIMSARRCFLTLSAAQH